MFESRNILALFLIANVRLPAMSGEYVTNARISAGEEGSKRQSGHLFSSSHGAIIEHDARYVGVE